MLKGSARNLKKECGGLAAGLVALIDERYFGLTRFPSDAPQSVSFGS
jgi:hypothetical protein